ncbi:hypothetical protein H4217_005065 [Coemansia sp. RSA 1939]|nr:hypothetical protein H4217_005065 [Coemansia sp. RSA 1939]
MDSDSSDVVAGIYPRRMGKTTFLQTLADFLGIIRPMPRADREDQFKRCALYDLHRDFFEENFAKYPVITMDFKNNEYLHKGILAGVFDIRGVGLGSGLNNVEVYMAHSGIQGTHSIPHPFRNAFGFTARDVWGLINDYVDNQWPYRENLGRTDADRFKRDLLVGCLENFDGYRIGDIYHIFNPYAILRFVHGLVSVESPSNVVYSGHLFWVETGSTRILEAIETAEISELRRFYRHLSLSFLRKTGYQRQTGIAADLMALDHINDTNVEFISSQMQSQSPFAESAEASSTRVELADICMSRVGDAFGDIHNMGSAPLKAGTIIRLLYQSGYIAPITRDCVGIPNVEVLDALEKLYKQIAKRHDISPNFLDSTHEDMGVCYGNVSQFARSLNKCLMRASGLAEVTLERMYQNILIIHLYPATRNGYEVQSEVDMGNGRADVLLVPSSSSIRTESNPFYFYIFELERYNGPATRENATRMTADYRRDVAKVVYDLAGDAQTQIHTRYLQAASDKARYCKYIFVIGIAFWTNRFSMVVTRLRKDDNDDGSTSWSVEQYPGSINSDGLVGYSDIGDELDSTENDGVRERVVQGKLVFLTV